MEGIKRFYCARFNRKSGKVDKVLTGLGKGMLEMWALHNTKAKTKDTIIFDEDGLVVLYLEGTGDFPQITRYGEKTAEGIHYIDEFSEGLLEIVAEMF